jgi:hypothetical protein
LVLKTTLCMYRHDIIAQIYYARKLAEKLQPVARMIELHGGHLVSHERTEEVFFIRSQLDYDKAGHGIMAW